MRKENGRVDAPSMSALGQNLRAESALLHAQDALEGLDFVVLKGGLLTRRIYANLAQRVSSDNDLLVRGRDASAALAKLLTAGYRAASRVDPFRSLFRTGRVELWPGGDVSLVTLDLHIRAFDGRLFHEDEEFIWSHLADAELHGRRVKVFDDALSLAHLAAHTLSHFASREHLAVLGRAWSSLGPSVSAERLHEAVRCTLGVTAFEFAIMLAREDDQVVPLPWAPRPQVRAWVRLARAAHWHQAHRSFRALVVALVARPTSALSLVQAAVYPGRDELYARYGRGALPRLWLRHLAYRLRA